MRRPPPYFPTIPLQMFIIHGEIVIELSLPCQLIILRMWQPFALATWSIGMIYDTPFIGQGMVCLNKAYWDREQHC